MQNSPDVWHGTTILTVRKNGLVAVGGDGQVSIGQTIIKANAKKVRRPGKGDVIGGFAGATADAFTLFERLEGKLEQYPGQLLRAAVELAKDWRTDKYLRRLEAMMIVADKDVSLVLTGTGDVLEPSEGGIFLLGAPWSPLPERERRQRRPSIQAVFQDAPASLPPHRTGWQILEEPLEVWNRGTVRSRREAAARMAAKVKFPVAALDSEDSPGSLPARKR